MAAPGALLDELTDFEATPAGPLDLGPGEDCFFGRREPEWPLPKAEPAAKGPLRDFSVSMPSLAALEVELEALPDQIRVSLAFLRSLCPQDIVRDEDAARLPPLLPPQSEAHRGRRTLVLDLDETLVHCHPSPVQRAPPPDLELRIEVSTPPLHAHVYVRPFAQLVLGLLGSVFEVVVFTASAAIYADQVLDFLDPDHKNVTHRLYRQHCTEIGGGHFKDMRRLGRRLEDVVLVDNSPLAAGITPDNGLLVSSWFGDDSRDQELLELVEVLSQCTVEASIPAFLAQRYGFSAFLRRQRQRQAAELGLRWAGCAG